MCCLVHLLILVTGEVLGKLHAVLRLHPSLQALEVGGQHGRQECSAWGTATHACLVLLDITVQAELQGLLETMALPCLQKLKISCASCDLCREIQSFLECYAWPR